MGTGQDVLLSPPRPTSPGVAADGSPFGVLAALVPEGVVVVDADPSGDPPPLHPDETELVAKAVEKRRRELAWGRSCAREALRGLGVAGDPGPAIGRGERGEPRWPRGVVGSITHCAGYCAAAVTSPTVVGALGIDAETGGLLPRRVWEMISTPADRQALAQSVGRRPGTYEVVLFSAKESVYKAWYPMTGQWLGFQDADLTIDPAAGTFRATLRIDTPPAVAQAWQGMQGRFAIAGSHVLTALWLPPTPG
jgi:4'-phosphopantetheinyl transferase EntD